MTCRAAAYYCRRCLVTCFVGSRIYRASRPKYRRRRMTLAGMRRRADSQRRYFIIDILLTDEPALYLHIFYEYFCDEFRCNTTKEMVAMSSLFISLSLDEATLRLCIYRHYK